MINPVYYAVSAFLAIIAYLPWPILQLIFLCFLLFIVKVVIKRLE